VRTEDQELHGRRETLESGSKNDERSRNRGRGSRMRSRTGLRKARGYPIGIYADREEE
jgi:hypothetical protein